MNMVDIIEAKKNGQALSEAQIRYFACGAADGSIPDYQLAALLMAIRLVGMSREETVALTLAMAHSGDMADLSSIGAFTVDKHSTGGVGDTTTLVLTPLVASCGVPVAKMSGRGLGHTGGTLDKLESISGFNVSLSMEQFTAQVKSIGCAVIGQTGDLAPADRTLYALRDVTSTVDSLPLIASSIMSKKLASGAQGIVLDVKTGAGALMQTVEDSIKLAQTMVRIGADAGRGMVALVTDMDEPLGTHVGNALEVKEAIDVLSGRVKGALLDVSLELGSRMLMLGGAAKEPQEAKAMLAEALESGRGLKKLEEMIEAQGGDARCARDTSLLPRANVIKAATAAVDGYVSGMDTIRMGNAAQSMGAGRKLKTDVIDHSVGFVLERRIGDKVRAGEPLATVHARDEQSADAAIAELRAAIRISGAQPKPTKLVHAIVDAEHVTRL